MRAEHADRSGVRYSLGDVLRHTKFGFRGVVVSWDRSARTDVRGWDGLVGSQLKDPNQQTFYDVLVATDDAAHFMGREVDMRYVAEENLEVVDSIAERRISNPITDQYMSGFNDQRGRFDPVTTLQYVFPDTEAYGSTPGATTTTTTSTTTSASSSTTSASSSSSSDVARAAFTRVARDVASVASAARDAARELGGADGHWQRELVDDLCRPLLDGSLHHDESMVGDTAVEWSEAEQGELFAAMGGVQDTVRDFYFSIYCMTEYLSNIMIFYNDYYYHAGVDHGGAMRRALREAAARGDSLLSRPACAARAVWIPRRRVRLGSTPSNGRFPVGRRRWFEERCAAALLPRPCLTT